MTDAIATTSTGLYASAGRMDALAKRVATGGAGAAETAVAAQTEATQFKAGIAMLKLQLDTEKQLLNVLA